MDERHSGDENIRHLVSWAAGRPDVRAALLTSTRAIPHGRVDQLSDYDVILVVEDVRPYFEDRSWLDAFGEVLVAYWDPIHPEPETGIDQVMNVIQFVGGLKIDFTVWPVELLRQIVAAPALPEELDAGYLVLLDKDDLTGTMRSPSYAAYIPARPDEATYQRFIEEFFSDVPYVAKCLWRGELLPAKWCLDYDMKHVYLLRALEWRVECDHGWAAPVGSLGKSLRKRLPPEIWAELEASYAGAGIAENWEALFATIAVFRRVLSEVGAHLGYAYPHELDRRVTAYAEQIRAMRSDKT
jgi:aminoglycoside 6-adenylyltransferase